MSAPVVSLATCPSAIAAVCSGRPSRRFATCRWTSPKARRWASSANPARARARSARVCLGLTAPTQGEPDLCGRGVRQAAGAARPVGGGAAISGMGAQPAPALRAFRRGAAARAGRRRRRAPRPRRRHAGERRARRRRRPAPAGAIVRRPAPARRDRARAGHAAPLHRLRRGRQRARCLGPGPGAEPDPRLAGASMASPLCSSRTTSRRPATSAIASR